MNNPWNEISPPKDDVSARRIDYTHPFDLFWARDFQGHYLFVCEVENDERLEKYKLPELEGVRGVFMPSNGKIRLILSLNDKSNWEMFYALCSDLVQATRTAKDAVVAVSIIQRRLQRWHDFLKHSCSGILPEQTIKGLIGELYFIQKHLMPKFGSGAAVSFWMGPEGAPQDFCINDSAIEVKCQLGTTQPYVRISSAEQLCPQLPEMFLYVVTLGKARVDNPVAVTLPLLVEALRQELEAEAPQQLERLNDLLFGLGYFESDKYQDYCYVITDEQMFGVVDGFPRVVAENLPTGVIKVSYDVGLSECMPFEKWPDWMEK